jgi:hypothetical protein
MSHVASSPMRVVRCLPASSLHFFIINYKFKYGLRAYLKFPPSSDSVAVTKILEFLDVRCTVLLEYMFIRLCLPAFLSL